MARQIIASGLLWVALAAPAADGLGLVTAPAVPLAPSTSHGTLILRDGMASRARTPAVVGDRLLARETVRVDTSLLTAASDSLWLELTPGKPRLALLTDFERSPEGGLVWRGRFAEDDPGYRSITLSVYAGILYGTLEAGSVEYALRPAAAGATELVTLAAGGPIHCAVGTDDPDGSPATEAFSAARETPPTANPSPADRDTAAADDGRTLAILVVNPPSLTERWGGPDYALAYAHHAVASLNTAFRNSLIDASAFLSGVGEWSSAAQEINQILDQATSDGALRAMRDQAHADLVAVVTDAARMGYCGIAHLMNKQRLGPQMESLAYSVTLVDCDGFDHKVFVHEIGHNLGAHHLPESAPPPEDLAFPYAFAYTDGNSISTVMASGARQLLFSNPLVTVNGVPAGIENERDNSRVLQQTAPIAAAFRSGGTPLPPAGVPPPVPPPPTETPASPTELRATVLSATEVRLRWKDNGSGEIAFQVEARKESGAYGVVAVVPRNTVEHTVDGLEPATAYRFRVLALGAQANSQYSNEVKATTHDAPPAAPVGLAAEPLSASEVTLRWDEVARATGYEVELHTADPTADRDATPIALGPDGAAVGGLEAATPYTFRVRAVNAVGVSAWSAPASATTDGPGGACVADGSTLCLLGDRFEARARWRNPHPPFGYGTAAARAAPGSGSTGLFTFFDPDNVELAVKMLDGRVVNGAFWHFYGALSDVEYWVSVRDSVDDASRTYHNAPFELCGRGDTRAFVDEPEGSAADLPAAALRLDAAGPPASLPRGAAGGEGTCTPGPETLCLADGRFQVEVEWENPHSEGDHGVGHVFAGLESDPSGHFWFFTPDNLELSVKILDGRPVNGHFWVFWGGLSDVGYTIHVTDTESGESHDFENPPLTLCGGAVTDLL
jgi:Metallo-peptidase family M12/Fibronectin type III domain